MACFHIFEGSCKVWGNFSWWVLDYINLYFTGNKACDECFPSYSSIAHDPANTQYDIEHWMFVLSLKLAVS